MTATAFTTWLDTFMDEKEIDTDQVITVTGPHWGDNIIPVEVVLEHIRIATPKSKRSSSRRS